MQDRAPRTRSLPDVERVSMLEATILLAYALARLVNIPGRELSVQLPGFYLEVVIDVYILVAILVAGLTATGADWLLRDHPSLNNRDTLPHVILPALTSVIIGIPLNQLPFSPVWWLGLVAGGTLLMSVLVAEYVSVDAADTFQPLAASWLVATSFTVYLILAVTLRDSGVRLFIALPVLTLAALLVSLRTLHLRLRGQWLVYEAMIIAFIVGQFVAGLHYWPISQFSFGLALIGITYAMSSLFTGFIEEKSMPKALLEPGLALLIAWGFAWWVR